MDMTLYILSDDGKTAKKTKTIERAKGSFDGSLYESESQTFPAYGEPINESVIATRMDDGRINMFVTAEGTDNVILPPNTLFPMQWTQAVLNKVSHGHDSFETLVLDTSDSSYVLRTSSAMRPYEETATGRQERAWLISAKYFTLNNNEYVYSEELILNEQGVELGENFMVDDIKFNIRTIDYQLIPSSCP